MRLFFFRQCYFVLFHCCFFECKDTTFLRLSKYDTTLVEILKLESWKEVDLKKVADKIQNEIKNKISQDNSKNSNLQEEVSTLRLLVFICLALIVVLILTLSFMLFAAESKINPLKNFIKRIVLNCSDISEKPRNNEGNDGSTHYNANDYNGLNSKIGKLERQFGDLQTKVNSLSSNTAQTTNPTPQQTQSQQTNNSQTKDNSLYFASKSDKQLTEPLPSSTNASFKVYAVNGNEVKFDYIGVVRNENWFEGICTIENAANDNLSDKKQIRTTEPGKVKKENNNWVVDKPAKIKFV
jgi:hypothetical protein